MHRAKRPRSFIGQVGRAGQTALRMNSGLRDSFWGRLQDFNAKSTVGRSVGRSGLPGVAGDAHDE